MESLWWVDGGSMSFTPSMKSSSASSASSAQVCSFEARVKYRAQGTKPDKRYPGTVTWTQAHNLFLRRLFFYSQWSFASFICEQSCSGSVKTFLCMRICYCYTHTGGILILYVTSSFLVDSETAHMHTDVCPAQSYQNNRASFVSMPGSKVVTFNLL